ncbi:CDP-glucose 4,6-dehydratase [Trinickia violacea]|uniref:CDP-glucose 4,6-dehydratase n=1 Tax=Trinickia violacea TaxID=2571746 RepID=A0A4P8IYH3_9BURK|nr:CDP-glucose 4,6-dehydratase [Trinickia violacea]QCP53496.1 CDP-glucose 4,6-dehydratase [Trinickia violacea]
MENMGVSDSFWRGKRVLVTGHTGFKGSWLCLWLQELGADVSGYALPPPTTPSLFEVARVGDSMHSVVGDIRDYDKLFDAVQSCRPETIIHMAAQPLVGRSYEAPVETYSTNLMGTVNLLEAVRRTDSVRAVINVTSDKCYENLEWLWGYRENDRMGGFDPYSNSKACAELITESYRNSFFNPADYLRHGVAVASARAGNVIGGGDWAQDRLVPDILRSLSSGRAVAIRNPNSIRPWQHVLEPLGGYLQLAEGLLADGPKYAGAWNFGPDDADTQPVRWIVERFASQWGPGARWEQHDTQQVHEANALKLDCSKARGLLGWKPRWRLSQAIDKIVEWHAAFLSEADMQALSHSQIRAYLDS